MLKTCDPHRRIDQWEATLNHVLSDPNWAADEIERLRDALESLTKDPPATLDEPDEDWEVIVQMRAIARGTLAPSMGRIVDNGDGSAKPC